MRAKVRAALDAIEDILMNADQDSADLAAILSALRGPDDGNEEKKAQTTIPVRCVTFPRLSAARGYLPITGSRCWSFGVYGKAYSLVAPAPVDHSKAPDHFSEHYKMAYNALMREDK